MRVVETVRAATAPLVRTVGRWFAENSPSPQSLLSSVLPALVLGGVATSWVGFSRTTWEPALVPLAAVAMASLVVGLGISRSGPVAVAVALWGGGFVAERAGRPFEVLGAAAFGALLFAVFELSSWAAGTVPRIRFPTGAGRARSLASAACTLGGFGLALVIGAVAGVGWGASALLAVLGGLAGLLAAGLLLAGLTGPRR